MRLNCLARAGARSVRRYARTGEEIGEERSMRLNCLARAGARSVRRYARTGEGDP